MKKNITTTFTILIILFSSINSWSQDIFLSKQTEIDNFDQSITSISGKLYISGLSIRDLSNLSNIKSVGALLIYENPELTNLNGLINILLVNNDLNIRNNEALTSLSGINNITKVGGNFIIKDNRNLSSLDNIPNITSVGNDLIIRSNKTLNNIHGLSNITSVGQHIIIYNNAALLNLEGLSNINSLEGIEIGENNSLTDLEGLPHITSLSGNLIIRDNASLNNLDRLSNITSIGGALSISDFNYTSLAGLSNITTIGGALSVYNNHSLTHLHDFENITSVGENLFIYNNETLTNLDGLSNSISIGGNVSISQNAILSNLDGLSNLTSIVGSLIISNNTVLNDLDGLSSITSIGGTLDIHDNISLNNLNSLSNLTVVGENVSIYNNVLLSNLNGLSKLTSVGNDFEIYDNVSLSNLDGLSKLNSVGNIFNIYNNVSLSNLDGLSKLKSVGNIFNIYNNASLSNIDGLFRLHSVGRHFIINNCASLSNVDGLSNLKSVGLDFEISYNASLSNLDGLSNLESVGNYLKIEYNYSLVNCCGIQKVLGNPEAIKYTSIFGNPSECSSKQEILKYYCNNSAISGVVFYDINKNKTQDDNEYGIPNIRLTSNIQEYIYSDNSGLYWERRDSGDLYQVMIIEDPMWQLTTDSISYNGIFDPNDITNNQKYFGLYPTFEKHEIKCNLASDPTRCNTEVSFFMKIQNNGTYTENGEVQLQYDEESSFINSEPYPDQIDSTNHVLTWHFDTFYPYACNDYRIILKMPNENSTGELMNFVMETYIDSLETLILEDAFDYASFVRCSFDPNDKTIHPGGVQDENYTLREETLLYTIRFQNTGNAEAIDIRIIDTLDNHFDLKSFKVVHSSFPVQTTLDGNVVNFFFHDIYLPASLWYESESHGFVSYEIKLRENAPDYTIIENTGHIIFDFNPAIVTNTTKNTMVEMIPTGTSEIKTPSLYIRPNPASDYIDVFSSSNHSLGEFSVYNTIGEIVIKSTTTTTQIDISKIPSGLYFIHTNLNGLDVVEKFVKQ